MLIHKHFFVVLINSHVYIVGENKYIIGIVLTRDEYRVGSKQNYRYVRQVRFKNRNTAVTLSTR